jgi:steroid delta-isomerase-like uncharacterized protein
VSVERNEVLTRRAIGIWTSGDVEAADEIYAPGYVNHQHSHPAAGGLRGVEAMKRFAAEFRSAFPNFRNSIDDQVAEGDRVVTRFKSRGTHKGRFLGLAPTHREITWTGITIDRVADGRIAESWASWDMPGMLQQLGAAAWPGDAPGAARDR